MLTAAESIFIDLCLEGFFFGLYSAIFAMYLQYQAAKKDTEKTKYILFYPICILYVLSMATFVLDISRLHKSGDAGTFTLLDLRLYLLESTIIGCCDFISQPILIYRCWVVWGCNIRVVIIPSILAFAYLAIWLATNGSIHLSPGKLPNAVWGNDMVLTSIIISLTVNALVTGLIVFRIFKVYLEANPWYEQNLGATRGSKLRPIIFVLIESGMIMFAVQMVRVVLTLIVLMDSAPENIINGLNIVIGPNEMLFGITPTIILVRVSMGLSFHDEKSLEEATVSLRFALDNPKSNPAAGSADTVGQESTGGDVQGLSDDIPTISSL